MPIPFDETPEPDPNFTYVGLFQYNQPTNLFEAMCPIWRCGRCAALVENTGRIDHLKWHMGVHH